MLDAITAAPAFVRNGRMDILAANRLGYALYSEMYAGPRRRANTAWFVFLDPRAPAHPVVGDLTLSFETMTLVGDSGLTMFAYTAEAGSKSEEALNLLASWTATLDPAELANVTDRA